MKKNKFLVLVSLCSVFAGMPTKACEIKDSTIGGAGGSFNKQKFETPDKANQNKKSEQDSKFLNYFLEFVLGFGGTHEGLSYFYGNEGQFYKKPAQYSLIGMYRNGNDDKINNKINKKGNTHENGIDQLTKILISEFRHHASYTLNSNEVVEKLKEVFSEQEVSKLREISKVKKQKMFGYEYEHDYHLFSSYHLKKIPENVLEPLLDLLGCQYAYQAYKEKLEFFVVRDQYDKTTFWLFCCPKSDQDLCKKLENKFFQRQEETPVLNPHINDKDSDEKFKKRCEGAYLDAKDACNAQNEILKKYNDVELFENDFMKELLEKNENLDFVGKFHFLSGKFQAYDVRSYCKDLIKFGD